MRRHGAAGIGIKAHVCIAPWLLTAQAASAGVNDFGPAPAKAALSWTPGPRGRGIWGGEKRDAMMHVSVINARCPPRGVQILKRN